MSTRSYSCSECNTITNLPFTQLSPKTFTCPNCKSIFDIKLDRSLVFKGKFTGNFYRKFAELGEIITYQNTKYHVVGISTKKDVSSFEKWNEYIIANATGDLFFLSHGKDFYSFLQEIDFKLIENDVATSQPIRFESKKYEYEFEATAETFCAEGLFFNDIGDRVRALTFEEAYEGTKFLSVEYYTVKVEAFSGIYLQESSFKKLFSSQREINYTKSNVAKNIALLFALVSVIMGMLHFVLNNNHTDMVSYTGMLTKQPNQHEFVKSGAYIVPKDNQKVTVEFVSETMNAATQLNVALVNEKTNETHILQGIKHFYNAKNYASSNKVQFCGINSGSYHLVFASNLSDQSQNNIDIDFKIQIGGTSLTWFYIALVILVIIGLFYNYIIAERVDLKTIQTFANFLKYKKYQALQIATSMLLFYIIGNYLFVSNQNCSNSINTSELENASYTGSRTHYVHRIYSSGSHK